MASQLPSKPKRERRAPARFQVVPRGPFRFDVIDTKTVDGDAYEIVHWCTTRHRANVVAKDESDKALLAKGETP